MAGSGQRFKSLSVHVFLLILVFLFLPIYVEQGLAGILHGDIGYRGKNV
jgi:hypothetical protein